MMEQPSQSIGNYTFGLGGISFFALFPRPKKDFAPKVFSLGTSFNFPTNKREGKAASINVNKLTYLLSLYLRT